MLHAYLTSRAARPIVAFLLAGSMMGFALGQQLGHRPAQAQTTPAVVRQISSGALGARTLSQPIQAAPVVAHTAPAPAKPPKHEKKHDEGDHHQGDEHGSHGDGGHGGDKGGGGGGSGGDSMSSD